MILSGGQGWSIIPSKNNVRVFRSTGLESYTTDETGVVCRERFTPISSIIGPVGDLTGFHRVY